MDFWGIFWLSVSLIVLPFGYKPIIALLSISSIFSASKILTIGSTDIPLFFGIEILTILRLFISYKVASVPKFNDKLTFHIFLFIILLWLYTYFATFLFSGIKVYSSLAESMEENYAMGGMPLSWSSANFNQLMLLTTHLILALLIYKRRFEISRKFYFVTIFSSVLIFSIISILWKLVPNIYLAFAKIIFNNLKYGTSAFHENRLSGTFLEPSSAGLFISMYCLVFLFHKKNIVKFLGLILIFLASLNVSSTLACGIVISCLILAVSLNFRLDHKVLFIMGFSLLTLTIYLSFQPIIDAYILNKNNSISGEVRGAANWNAIDNIVSTGFLGLGLGSERTSSLFITLLNNLGIPLTCYFIYIMSILLELNSSKKQDFLMICFIISIFTAFVSVPEITVPIIWTLIFANICRENNINLKTSNN